MFITPVFPCQDREKQKGLTLEKIIATLVFRLSSSMKKALRFHSQCADKQGECKNRCPLSNMDFWPLACTS